jgi:hypothetical protein
LGVILYEVCWNRGGSLCCMLSDSALSNSLLLNGYLYPFKQGGGGRLPSVLSHSNRMLCCSWILIVTESSPGWVIGWWGPGFEVSSSCEHWVWCKEWGQSRWKAKGSIMCLVWRGLSCFHSIDKRERSSHHKRDLSQEMGYWSWYCAPNSHGNGTMWDHARSTTCRASLKDPTVTSTFFHMQHPVLHWYNVFHHKSPCVATSVHKYSLMAWGMTCSILSRKSQKWQMP